ncbi:hypothetical protein DFH09DRAFT_1128127 [Mycena vulgaris]|nr:hypothetical protein DFH09DRAFT_1128127 [Mycena vulgaris]
MECIAEPSSDSDAAQFDSTRARRPTQPCRTKQSPSSFSVALVPFLRVFRGRKSPSSMIYCRVKPKSCGLFCKVRTHPFVLSSKPDFSLQIPPIYAAARRTQSVARTLMCVPLFSLYTLASPAMVGIRPARPGACARCNRVVRTRKPAAARGPVLAGQLSSSAYAEQANVRCVVPVTRGLRTHCYRARVQALCPVPALAEGGSAVSSHVW